MEQQLTPKKVYPRTNQKLCRLYLKNSTRFLRIFSIAGKSKDLCNKIKVITGITIVETGTNTCIIYRSCNRFIDTIL